MTPLYRETDCGGRLTPYMGRWPVVDDSAFVFHGAQVIGDVEIAANVSIWHNCVLRGDVNHIRIGERTNIQDGTVIHVSTRTHPTIIGRDVLVGHKVMLHACTLEDHAFVGMSAIVMDNARVCTDGMLAAGAMLTPGKTVGSGELWAGSPAKFMRAVTPEETLRNRKMAAHYHRLAEQHRMDALGRPHDLPAYP
ncbi:gamma carbonic anhydrase family protein [Gimibacter soli]|uniref:Gamma carbonic anhydrase family protein n=2 Tax=Gimibacter soli TaxID=3024400 RepID=A0AAE9XKZ3_9PROT|nr:gamma carbonic anhydrase family protein [Gimibacter soli]WCL52842.1 gamma carbonic anhydrase family protein [Gimibacter soli]